MASISEIFKKLRLSDPWNYKAPVLISIPYFVMAAGKMSLEQAYLALGASFLTIIGIAGFGYYLNDLSDMEQDAQIGKANAFENTNWTKRIIVFLLLIAAAVSPWLFVFPVTGLSIGLLLFEAFLFIAYSLPPFRFKERGFLGVLCDALYAHATPSLLAAYTFHLMAGEPYGDFWFFVIALTTWQFALGIRNIILHQLADYENDVASGTQTFVTQTGKQANQSFMVNVLFPLEILSFIALSVILSYEMPYLIPINLLFIAYVWWRNHKLHNTPIPREIRQLAYKYLDDFYKECFPLIILLYLCIYQPLFLPIAAFHLWAFRHTLTVVWGDVKQLMG